MQQKRFELHVYKIVGRETHYFDTEIAARKQATIEFDQTGVYKVKLWDHSKGEIIPNRHNTPGLILELV